MISRDGCGGGISVFDLIVFLDSVVSVLQLGQRRKYEHEGRDQDDSQRYEGRHLQDKEAYT